ncbi:hypothetical protein Tco_0628652 [Tanacetum coccineum]|uniref:Uncharacterized protein n=1 Tax=Tanacetum coccineum TaxID=301880 RepID=A0ABQ4WQX1_9ASTR
MDVDGTFTLTNIGKSSVSMNGNLVAPEQVAALGSIGLIEVREHLHNKRKIIDLKLRGTQDAENVENVADTSRAVSVHILA